MAAPIAFKRVEVHVDGQVLSCIVDNSSEVSMTLKLARDGSTHLALSRVYKGHYISSLPVKTSIQQKLF